MDFFRATLAGSAADYFATTTDGDFPLHWRMGNGGNPILSPGSTGSFDDKYAHKPFVFRHGGRTLHYYTAVATDNTRRVALATDLATAPSFATADPVRGGTTDALMTSLLDSLEALGLRVLTTISDDFNRADGALGSTSVGGKAWGYSGGAGWAILSNAARRTGTSDGMAAVNTGIADNYEIQMTATSITGTYPLAILVRGEAPDSYVKLYRSQSSNNWTLADSGTTPNAANVIHATDIVSGDTIMVCVQGTTITCFLNSVQVAQWTRTSHNSAYSTYQGIGGSGNAALTVENFSVTPI